MPTVVTVAVIGAAWLVLSVGCALVLGRAVRYRDAGQPAPPDEGEDEDPDGEPTIPT